jgi:hypothetical protein
MPNNNNNKPVAHKKTSKKLYCGAKKVPVGYKKGTSKQCFTRGLFIGKFSHDKKAGLPQNSVQRIKGIGPDFANKLKTQHAITTKTQLYNYYNKMPNNTVRRTKMKQMFQGFKSKKVNRGAFTGVADFLNKKNSKITIAPMK